MLALLYTALSFFAGLVIVQRLFPRMPPLVRIAGGYLVGVTAANWLVFLTGFGLAHLTHESVLIGIGITIALLITVIVTWGRHIRFRDFTLNRGELVLIGASILFSSWLMYARLSGDPLTVAREPWGDTSYHIAILRSFSWGHNFPPEFPFFGGEMMRYHFGTDFLAGSLEKAGLSVQWALNLPGVLGFTALMVIVYEMGRLLFRSRGVGVLAVILLVANSSLAFLRYFELHDNNLLEVASNFWSHQGYVAIGPYSLTGEVPDKISLFWTPNIWLTQTQLILGMASMLWVAFGVMQPLKEGRPFPKREALALGAIMGSLFWVNGVLFIPAVLFMIALLIAFGRWKEGLPFLVLAGLLSLPQLIWLNGGNIGTGGSIGIHLGYLVQDFNPIRLSSWLDFLEYWWLNLGLMLPLLILGSVLAGRGERKVFLAITAIFIFGNIIALGRDVGGHNHKVFNLWLILANLFAAFAFVRLWTLIHQVKLSSSKTRAKAFLWASRASMSVLFLLLVLSGIVDAMVLKNDPRFEVFGEREPVVHWIRENTPRDAMFLTAYGQVYTTPTLAGRKVFWGGFEPWTIDKGHEVEPRRQIIHDIYTARSKEEACRLLVENNIDYLVIGPEERNSARFEINEGLFEREFSVAGRLDESRVVIYDVAASCSSS